MKKSNLFKSKSILLTIAISLLMFFIYGCNQKTSVNEVDEEQKAKEEKMIELTYTCLDIWSSGNLSLVNEVYSQEMIRHWVGGDEIVGIDAYIEEIKKFKTAFPDMHFEVNNLFVRGEKVYYELIMYATHTGVFGDVPPTGKKVIWDILEIDRIVDGKIVEEWGYSDKLDLMTQLGCTIVPPEVSDK